MAVTAAASAAALVVEIFMRREHDRLPYPVYVAAVSIQYPLETPSLTGLGPLPTMMV